MKGINLPHPKTYPKYIHFSDSVWHIKFKKNLNCYGLTSASKKTIYIKKGLSARQTLSTFIHELLHVIEFDHPVKLKHKTIYKLEAAILEILLDNFL